MKKVVITKAGHANVLQVQEAPDLIAKDNEVRIAVKAAGLNFADILARQGLYPDAPKTPCTVGYEVSGEIDAIGNKVDKSWLGKKVIALTRFGGQAEQVVVPVHQVFEKPESLSFEAAAAIPVNYLTAYQLLVAMGGLQAHESVLIHNVGGGVGLAALEIAKHIGATIYGTASSSKHQFLKDRGLNHAIDYRTQDWQKEIIALTDGRGVDLVTDPIGGENLKQSYKVLANTGRLGMFGISSVSASGVKGKLNMLKMIVKTPFYHPFGLMDQNKGVFGVNMGHLWHEYLKIDIWMQEILKGYAEGWIKPHIDSTFSFADAAKAHEYIEQRKNIGKVILLP